MIILKTLLALTITFTIISLLVIFIKWLTHMSMTKDSCDSYGYAGYKSFIKEIESNNGWYRKHYKLSLFNEDYQRNYIHSDIYKFNFKGMIMRTPLDYLISKLYLRKYIKNKFNVGNVVKWLLEIIK